MKSKRGFASMSKDLQRSIASKGGLSVSMNSAHMAEIGRRGGEESGRRRRKVPHSNVETNQNNI